MTGWSERKNPLRKLRGFIFINEILRQATDRKSAQVWTNQYYLLTYITSLTALTTFSALGKLAAIKVGA